MPEVLTGRRLDAAVAESFGLKVEWVSEKPFSLWPPGFAPGSPIVRADGTELLEVPHYSTDIAAAWFVVETLRKRGWLVVVKEMPDGFPFRLADDMPEAKIVRRAACSLDWMPRDRREDVHRAIFASPFAVADSAPEAICRAALAAARADEDAKKSQAEFLRPVYVKE